MPDLLVAFYPWRRGRLLAGEGGERLQRVVAVKAQTDPNTSWLGYFERIDYPMLFCV
jgi:hypothetical protein